MTGGRAAIAVSLFFVLMMSIVSPSDSRPSFDLRDESLRMEQFGGGGSLEDQCGSITFEDMFEYTLSLIHI